MKKSWIKSILFFLIAVVIFFIVWVSCARAYDYEKQIDYSVGVNDTWSKSIITSINNTLRFSSNSTYLKFSSSMFFENTNESIFNVNISVPPGEKPINRTDEIKVTNDFTNETISFTFYFQIYNSTSPPVVKGFALVTPTLYEIYLNNSELPFYQNITIEIANKENRYEFLTIYCDPYLECPLEANLTPLAKNLSIRISIPKESPPGSYDKRLIFLREGNTTFVHFKFVILETPILPRYYNEEVEECLREYYFSKNDTQFRTMGEALDFCFAKIYNESMVKEVNVTSYVNVTVPVEVLKYNDVKETLDDVVLRYEETKGKQLDEKITKLTDNYDQLNLFVDGINGTIEGLMQGQYMLREMKDQEIANEKKKRKSTIIWMSVMSLFIVAGSIIVPKIKNNLSSEV